MGWRYEHEQDCIEYLGVDCYEVHAWMDECARKYPVNQYGDLHRKFRHNWYGVEYCKEKWGPLGEKAALLHLVRDKFWMMPKDMDLDQLLIRGKMIAEEGLYPYTLSKVEKQYG